MEGEDDVIDDGTAPDDGGAPGDEAAPDEVPEPPQTGDAGVDAAVRELAEVVRGRLEGQLEGQLDGPLDGQVAAYEQVHRALQDRLADVEG